MAKNNSILYYTTNIFNKDFYLESEYEDYKKDFGYVGDFENWAYDKRDLDWDDFIDMIKYVNFGDSTIRGSIGAWDGRHEIVPVRCKTLLEAIEKCVFNQDDFEIRSYKSKIVIDTYNHDSQYHGGNHFEIRTKEKREDMYLY